MPPIPFHVYLSSILHRYHAVRLHRRGCDQGHQGAATRHPVSRKAQGYKGNRGEKVRTVCCRARTLLTYFIE